MLITDDDSCWKRMGDKFNEENSLVCLKIMYLPYLLIARFKSEVTKSMNHCNFEIVAKSQKCKF